MTEEASKGSPGPSSMLLEENPSIGGGVPDWVIPASAFAVVVGAAIVLRSKSSSDKGSSARSSNRSSGGTAPDGLVFNSNMKGWSMGDRFEEDVLIPYLAYQAEGGSLKTMGHPENSSRIEIDSSRGLVAKSFSMTEKARFSGDEIFISEIPTEHKGKSDFNKWLDSAIMRFQGSY